jgi:hypothetical protein
LTQKIDDRAPAPTLLDTSGEAVMSRKSRRHDSDQDQDQDQKQDQRQAELQAQLQAQLQGQAQGQAQGQGQYQFALSENKNENENDNENKNENENTNENKVENEVDNKLENSAENKLESKVDNDVENKIENVVENKVDTDVDVDVNVDLDLDDLGPASDDDIIDIDWIKDIDDSVVMPDAVSQTLTGNGNQFNIDQVNNLVDRDTLSSPNNTGSVTQDLKAEGGESKIDDVKAEVDGNRSTMGDAGTATADALSTAEAFAQNIVMGANIQFNNIEMSVAGGNLTTGDGDDGL